jgi:hypothetical protein
MILFKNHFYKQLYYIFLSIYIDSFLTIEMFKLLMLGKWSNKSQLIFFWSLSFLFTKKKTNQKKKKTYSPQGGGYKVSIQIQRGILSIIKFYSVSIFIFTPNKNKHTAVTDLEGAGGPPPKWQYYNSGVKMTEILDTQSRKFLDSPLHSYSTVHCKIAICLTF